MQLAINNRVLMLPTLNLRQQRPHPILKHRYLCNLVLKNLHFGSIASHRVTSSCLRQMQLTLRCDNHQLLLAESQGA